MPQLERLAQAQTPISPTTEVEPDRPANTRPVALVRGYLRRLGAKPLRELLRYLRARLRRHQAARRRRRQSAYQDLQPGRPGWQGPQTVGGSPAPRAEAARQGQPPLDRRRPLARHRDLPQPLGRRILGRRARRTRRPVRDVASAPRQDARRPRPRRLHSRIRVHRHVRQLSPVRGGRSHPTALLQPPRRVRRHVPHSPRTPLPGHGPRLAHRQPRQAHQRQRSRRRIRDRRAAHRR